MNKSVDKLESVNAAFEHWRETRTSQGKIPDYLWEQVKALLDTYPLSKICSTLKVSHVQIKENIIDVVNRFQFIEVNNQAVLPELSPEFDIHDDYCSIELCRASGDGLDILVFISPLPKIRRLRFDTVMPVFFMVFIAKMKTVFWQEYIAMTTVMVTRIILYYIKVPTMVITGYQLPDYLKTIRVMVYFMMCIAISCFVLQQADTRIKKKDGYLY